LKNNPLLFWGDKMNIEIDDELIQKWKEAMKREGYDAPQTVLEWKQTIQDVIKDSFSAFGEE